MSEEERKVAMENIEKIINKPVTIIKEPSSESE
jgi:hypothetical protein